mmetsp:Transcript_2052/g.4432  ORF Transcript_2052/g.4432 Transcript_2052/m.4432 type:complete len:314 (-) Transcript_2052:215-1156(-)|eukprot:CAMPEP_0201132088 /NCGR_PEP_ID=MMETSP0850-20130426/44724_1 /ASSEMBLY_ACC=CAM_ASM_000622 /TAXON_ID=183588 /ORGANISM="Pseudo-nitzschia fraudulenta, Strain WWA7" /LENGTH=313 /DNA_ID=CAMNT_0047402321 /DNA_START=249 /DNA_END=1190 /DNA_ORIENTATION=-
MSAMAKAQKGKAEAFIKEAEGLLSKKSWFSSSKERNAEEAAEVFEKAANAYKVGGLNQDAGNTYTRAAELYRDKISDFNHASKAFNAAGSCYKKSNPADAVNAYKQAVSLYVDNARITQAAKLSKEIAELYENEEIDEKNKSHIVLAIEAYEQASELFGMEDSKSSTSQCLAKIAELCSAALDPPDYSRASKMYDDLGRRCLTSNLLKFNAKGYFLQAILCHLANGDDVGAEQAGAKYESLDYTFGDSREGKFANALIEAVKGYDVEEFSTACYDFDRISKLNPWQTSILVKVKRGIDEGGGGDDDDSDVDLT